MAENRIRVLLVEDNPGDARWVSNFLAEAPAEASAPSFEVVHVERLGQALDRLAKESFDLVLLDLTLPNSQGLSTLHQILDVVPDLPVVIISGMRGRQLALTAVEAGAQDYLIKGQITPDSLPRTLQYAIARKRDQKELREREAQYRALVESTPCLICALAPNGDTLFVNPYVLAVTGYSPEELIDRNWWDLFYPGELRAQVHALYAAFEKGDVRDYEMTLMDRQGRQHVLSWSSFNVWDRSHEKLLQIHGVGLDITERKRMEEDLHRRTAQLRALHEIGLELTAQLDLGVLLQTIVERAVAVLGGQIGSLGLYQPDRDILSEILTVGHTPIQGTTALRRGEGMFGRVLETGQPLLIDDYQSWPGRLAAYEQVPLRGVMAVPIRWGEELLGVLGVGSHTPGAFSSEDLELLTVLATQASIAIHNAQLFAAERTARQQAERLYAAAQALSASLDLSRVFASILSELHQVVPYDSASVQQLQQETLQIIGGHGFPNLNELLGVTFDLNADDNPNREVIRTRQPLILDDAPLLYAGFRRAPHRQANIRSWLGVPLLFGDRLIGMITLDKREPGFYTQEHARLAMAFAAQAAIAIENARLYQEAQQRLRELTLLFEISATLATSLDRNTVLHTIAHQIVSALGIEGCAISQWDQEQDALITLIDFTLDLEQWQPVPLGTVYPLTDYPAIRRVLTERQPLVVRRSNDHADPGELAWMRAEGLCSALLVPMVVADRAIGLLELMESQQERNFSPNEINLCQTLANQAAAALENARLYEEAQRRNRELALLN
ncbi:MAG: GAF domain-containing protein, partial [Anaerolineae bacterium]